MLLLDLAVLLLFAGLASVLGGKALRLAGASDLGEGEAFFFSFGAGIIIISYLVLFAGLAGALKPLYFIVAAAAAAAAWRKELAAAAGLAWKELLAFWREERSAFDSVLLAILAVTVISNIFFNYAPPTGEDELIYHLSLPARYLRHGRIFNDPYDPFSGFFLTLNLAYIPLMALKSALTAKLLSVFFGVMDCALLYFLARTFVGARYALLAAALFYTSPMTIGLSGTGKIDLGLTYYALLAFFSWLRYKDAAAPGAEKKWLILFMFAAGALAAGKMTGPFFAVALGLMLGGVLLVKKKTPAGCLRLLGAYGLVVTAFLLPWLVKNLVWTGNPLYPARLPWGLPYDEAFSCLLSAKASVSPLALAEKYFFDLITGTGYVIAAFLPVYLFLGGKDRQVNALLAFPAVFLPVIFVSGYALDMARYSHACYAVFAVAAAYAVLRTAQEHPGLKAPVLVLAAALIVLPNALMSVYFGVKRIPFALGLQTEDQYLGREYEAEGWPVVRWVAQNVPEKDAVLVLGDVFFRTYYYKQRIIAGNRPSLLELPFSEARKFLAENGIRYIILDKGRYSLEGGVYRNKAYGWLSVHWFKDDSISNYFDLAYSGGDIAVYRAR
ncbi:MAG: hypothetical protein A2X35_01050 [Elusimicrobia bacterium GWA2_61_42]|nr:MAG: hypothetical protein A2X35_01050 [Elusimicrobia bacterium GWA2_61_42]OGR75199.1 MAG: hypothetical protein A2X38_04735 [Elusimicrobia bacterium GWC2_61_25]